MKIAVLGSNGFVGSSLVRYLSKTFDVFPINRAVLNLLDPLQVKELLQLYRFDIVINAAASMNGHESFMDTKNNLGLFMNFYNNCEHFGRFINLGSGAEFDRSKNIYLACEDTIKNVLPSDSYGFSQNLKARLCSMNPQFTTLRIFNCFGKNEPPTRIFPLFLKNQNSHRFEVTNDRYFDYFAIQDLCKVVQYCVENNLADKDINCVYTEKYKISEVLKLFARIHDLADNIVVVSSSENNYTGNASKLKSLDLNLIGLEEGLRQYNLGIRNE